MCVEELGERLLDDSPGCSRGGAQAQAVAAPNDKTYMKDIEYAPRRSEQRNVTGTGHAANVRERPFGKDAKGRGLLRQLFNQRQPSRLRHRASAIGDVLDDAAPLVLLDPIEHVMIAAAPPHFAVAVTHLAQGVGE